MLNRELLQYEWAKFYPSAVELPDAIRHALSATAPENLVPPEDTLLAPFKFFPPEETRLIIVSSSPSSPFSNGLACSWDGRFALGLLAEGYSLVDESLVSIAWQGVLFLNIRPFRGRMHKGLGWERVGRKFLSAFSRAYPGRPYILLGSAKKFSRSIGPGNKVIEAGKYPSGFEEANEYLERREIRPVQWEGRS